MGKLFSPEIHNSIEYPSIHKPYYLTDVASKNVEVASSLAFSIENMVFLVYTVVIILYIYTFKIRLLIFSARPQGFVPFTPKYFSLLF